MTSRIVILIHEFDRIDHPPYYIGPMADIWRRDGYDVTVINDPATQIDADLAFLHVDLTVTPEPYLAFARRYPVAVNAAVADISKRAISDRILRRDSDHPGPVIVKTNANTGGAREERIARRRTLTRLTHAFRDRLHWSLRTSISPACYPIYPSLADVPATVWLNAHFVVERFEPERRGEHYCLRTWCFLGDRETNSLCIATEPIVKAANIVGRELVPDVPDDLRDLRRKLGFDYGKFDYAIVDGRAVLYDANRTPSMGRLPAEIVGPNTAALAPGIAAFLPAPAVRIAIPLDASDDPDDTDDRALPDEPLEPDPPALPDPAPPPTGHWHKAPAVWRHFGPPLRPCLDDTAFLASLIRRRPADQPPPRALILGVTPELFHLPWPDDADIKAVDHTRSMIDSIWPGPPADAICAKWTDIPLDPASRDLVFCDGGLNQLRFPDTLADFADSMRRIVAPGGLCAFRLFTPPPIGSAHHGESADRVLDDLLAGKIPDLNVLKLRLWMALQADPADGVVVADIWSAVHGRAPDLPSLARDIGWPLDHLHAIDFYRDSPSRYHFPTADQVSAIFRDTARGFTRTDLFTPRYPTGPQCPTVVFQRVDDHAGPK